MLREIWATIIIYDPNWNRLKKAIYAIGKQVDRLVLFENGIFGTSEYIQNNIKALSTNIEVRTALENMGIAAALNKVCEYAMGNDVKWIVTLDQDSIVADNFIDEYKKSIWLNSDKCMAYVPTVIDENYPDEKHIPKKKEDLMFSITSGMMIDLEYFKELGGFNERLFIDFVDFDYCIRGYNNNFFIKEVPTTYIMHQLGDMSVKNIMGKTLRLTNHSPYRNYFYVRNGIYLMITYCNKYSMDILYKVIRKILLVLLFQKYKKENFFKMCKGVLDAVYMCLEG